MSTLIAIPLSLLSAFFWLAKFTFYGGWFMARWLLWTMSSVWAVIAALGALCGLLVSK